MYTEPIVGYQSNAYFRDNNSLWVDVFSDTSISGTWEYHPQAKHPLSSAQELLDIVNTETDAKLTTKQDTLTAGDNIIIEGNVISATGGGGDTSDDMLFWNCSDVSFPDIYDRNVTMPAGRFNKIIQGINKALELGKDGIAISTDRNQKSSVEAQYPMLYAKGLRTLLQTKPSTLEFQGPVIRLKSSSYLPLLVTYVYMLD